MANVERPLIAVVGAESLLARELRAILVERQPAPRIELVSGGRDDSSILSALEDEPVAMAGLREGSLNDARVVFLAGSQATSRRAFRISQTSGAALIDLTGALEEQPHARLRAPSVETEPLPLSREYVHVIAQPAAIALARFFSRLDACTVIRRSIVQIFEPVSERGQRGLDELQRQTAALLSFQKLPTDVFDTQVSFNMLARYGSEAMEPLEDVEARIDRHLATLLGPWPRVPMPSLRLVHAPVFHGYSFSVWVEMEENPGADALAAALAATDVEVRTADQETPSNVGAAGQNGITIGAISADRNQPRACWFWVVADNLRLAAENAVAAALELL